MRDIFGVIEIFIAEGVSTVGARELKDNDLASLSPSWPAISGDAEVVLGLMESYRDWMIPPPRTWSPR